MRAKVLFEATKGFIYGSHTSVKPFVERLLLNELNCYLLYFPEENHKQLDQNEIIEILIKPRLYILSGMKRW
jgi:hypothetical protein